jgi:hypothetical protein
LWPATGTRPGQFGKVVVDAKLKILLARLSQPEHAGG